MDQEAAAGGNHGEAHQAERRTGAGAQGCAEGMPEALAGADIPKFAPDGLLIVHAGGGAGLFSAVIGGWVRGDIGSQPVTREVVP